MIEQPESQALGAVKSELSLVAAARKPKHALGNARTRPHVPVARGARGIGGLAFLSVTRRASCGTLPTRMPSTSGRVPCRQFTRSGGARHMLRMLGPTEAPPTARRPCATAGATNYPPSTRFGG